MKQTTIIAMLASLLFNGVATACQHNVATIPAQDYAGNAFNTSAAPSPDIKDRKKQAGKDEVIDTREYQVKDFDHIDCGTIANIYFTQGNETRVVAKLHHGNLDLLEVSTHNGCLKLRTADLGLPTKRFSIGKRNRAYVGDLDGKHSEQQEVDLYITAPSLRKLEMSGVCTFSAEHLNVPKLDIVMAGVNQVKLSDVTCNETNMMISGVSSMDATITGDQIHLVNTGSGNTTIHFKGAKAEIVNSGVGVLAATDHIQAAPHRRHGICRYRRDNGHHARIGATNSEQSATNDSQTISFYIMQDEQINNLVERFLDGETTLAEEKQLYDYFSQNENVDESLLPYAEYFRDLAVLPSPQKEEKPRKRPRWTIRWTQWAVGAAAAVLISLGGMWIYTLQEERHLAQLYGGSYMIVDGKRYDNLREIKDDIRQTLADAQQIERQADGQAVIEEAEQEVLESIGDPAERQKLKEILKN